MLLSGKTGATLSGSVKRGQLNLVIGFKVFIYGDSPLFFTFSRQLCMLIWGGADLYTRT